MKTAMQELLSEMSHPNWDRLSFDARYEMFDKLLNLEKEQIIDAHIEGQRIFDNHTHTQWTNDQAEEYYNQTYNQNK
jgi:hypothetical protein